MGLLFEFEANLDILVELFEGISDGVESVDGGHIRGVNFRHTIYNCLYY